MKNEQAKIMVQDAINAYLYGDKKALYGRPYACLLQLWYNHHDENDWRSGEETYGYDNIDTDMMYISDRWKTQFRMKWLIDGIEQEKF